MKHMRIVAPGVATMILWASPLVSPVHAQTERVQARPAAPEQPGWFDAPQRPRQKVEVLTIDGDWHKAAFGS